MSYPDTIRSKILYPESSYNILNKAYVFPALELPIAQ